MVPAPLQEPEAEPVSVQQSSAAELYAKLAAEYDEAYSAYQQEMYAAWQAAEEAGEEFTDYPEEPSAKFLPKFVEAAKQFDGTADSVQFHVWIVQNGMYSPDDVAKSSLKKVVSGYADHIGLAPLGPMLPQLGWVLGADVEAMAIAAKLEKATQSDSLRAWAMYTRLAPVFKSNGPKSEAFIAAKKEMAAALAKANDEYLQQTFDSEVTVLEKFGNGMLAPDIMGVDLDGVEFSLSDYKGKVIFLDFWGDW